MLPGGLWESILLYWVLAKLDTESRKLFESDHPDTDVLTFNQLPGFMDRRSSTSESSGDQSEASILKTVEKVCQEAYFSTVVPLNCSFF